MELIKQLDKELKEFKFDRALNIVKNNTGKDVGDFGGLYGLIEHCLNNGFNEEADLLTKTFKGE
tara:strand:+ start:280 stop:471 length:192 start_codon:yes stop_codon:yes gene_type:complete